VSPAQLGFDRTLTPEPLEPAEAAPPSNWRAGQRRDLQVVVNFDELRTPSVSARPEVGEATACLGAVSCPLRDADSLGAGSDVVAAAPHAALGVPRTVWKTGSILLLFAGLALLLGRQQVAQPAVAGMLHFEEDERLVSDRLGCVDAAAALFKVVREAVTQRQAGVESFSALLAAETGDDVILGKSGPVVFDGIREVLNAASLADAFRGGAVFTVTDLDRLTACELAPQHTAAVGDGGNKRGGLERPQERSSTSDGLLLAQGDIVVPNHTSVEEPAVMRLLASFGHSGGLAGKPWVGGRVKYCLATDLSMAARHAFELARDHLHAQVPCIRLVEAQTAGRTCVETPSIIVTSDVTDGCWSYLGQDSGLEHRGRSQALNLGLGCEVMGVALHELGHALGLPHEHSRPDRGKFIEVHWDKAGPAWRDSLKAGPLPTSRSAYDMFSIMHVGASAFSERGEVTLEALDSDFTQYLGQINGLSQRDVERLGDAYGCLADVTPEVKNNELAKVLKAETHAGVAPLTHSGCLCKSVNIAGDFVSACSQDTGWCCNPDNDPGGAWCHTQGECWGRDRDYCTPRPQAIAPTTRSGCSCSALQSRTCASSENGFCCGGRSRAALPAVAEPGDWCYTQGDCSGRDWDYCYPPTSMGSTSTTTPLPAVVTEDPPYWHLVDGGISRGCRGQDYSDKLATYFVTHDSVDSLRHCQRICMAKGAVCRGVEYKSAHGQCEVWTKEVTSSAAVPNSFCLRYEPPSTTTSSMTSTTRTSSTVTRTTRTGTTTTETTTTRTSSSTWTTSSSTRTSTRIALPGDEEALGLEPWENVDGGHMATCLPRQSDDTVQPGAHSLVSCKEACTKAGRCYGIEYSEVVSECKLWTNPISSSERQANFQCLRYNGIALGRYDKPPETLPSWTEMMPWKHVNGGIDQACRGTDSEDDDVNYFEVHFDVPSLGHCAALCDKVSSCSGVEFGEDFSGRCELWTRKEPRSSAYVGGFTCLRKVFPIWAARPPWTPVGGGAGRACRGDGPGDDSRGYYILHRGIPTLEDCRTKCLDLIEPLVCYGIEHSKAQDRCEVWTRPVSSSAEVEGFTCLSYGKVATHRRLRRLGI